MGASCLVTQSGEVNTSVIVFGEWHVVVDWMESGD